MSEMLFRTLLLLQYLIKSLHSNLTGSGSLPVIYGNALVRGDGDVLIGKFTLLGVLHEFLWNRNIVTFLNEYRANVAYIDLIRNELGADRDSPIAMRMTAQNILIIKYQVTGCIYLRKLAYNETGKGYLQRQITSLRQLQDMPQIADLGLEIPMYKQHYCDDGMLVLEQTYICGQVIDVNQCQEAQLLSLFKEGVDNAIKLNRCLKMEATGWAVYQKFNTIAQRYSHADRFELIVNYITSWLTKAGAKEAYIHGDYQFGNLIFNDAKLVGLIDWDRSAMGGTEYHDMLHLAVSTAARSQSKYYGEIVKDVLLDRVDGTLLSSCFDYIQNTTKAGFADLQHMTIVLWLFYLQISIDENQDVTNRWVLKMIDEVLPSVYDFCRTRSRTA